MKDKPIESKVASVFVHVRNMERAVKWYSEFFEVDIKPGPYEKMYTFELDNLYLLLDSHLSDNIQTTKQALFSLSTENIDKSYEYLKEKGVQIIGDIERFPDISFITVQDIDGNRFMVVQE